MKLLAFSLNDEKRGGKIHPPVNKPHSTFLHWNRCQVGVKDMGWTMLANWRSSRCDYTQITNQSQVVPDARVSLTLSYVPTTLKTTFQHWASEPLSGKHGLRSLRKFCQVVWQTDYTVQRKDQAQGKSERWIYSPLGTAGLTSVKTNEWAAI